MSAKVAIVSKLDDDEAIRVAIEIYRALKRRKVSVAPEIQLARKAKLEGGKDFSELNADLLVTVGGDGTVLKTCMEMRKPGTPILAVNMGRRGFLTEVAPKDALKAINSFFKGECRLEERAKLSVAVGNQVVAEGLNEAVVTSGTPSKMLHFSIKIDNVQVFEFRADGVILSTPTGSTAHSQSAGGPILDGTLDAFVVSFICPLENLSPLVISMNKNIEVGLINSKLRGNLVVDGRFLREFAPDTKLSVRKSPHKAVFVRLKVAPAIRSLMRLQPMEPPLG